MDDLEKRIEEITSELRKLLLQQVSKNNDKGMDTMKYNNKSIKWRADGRYYARYYNQEGKQVSVYGKTQKECLENLKNALKENKLNNKIGTNQKAKPLTLENWIKQWLSLFKLNKVRKSTYEDMEHRLKKYVLSQSISQMYLKNITAIEIQELLNNISAGRMREHIFTYLKDCLTKAKQIGYIKLDLFTFIKLPKREKRQGRALTLEEEQRFKSACNRHQYGDYFLFILATGLRKGEARALLKSDIDYSNKTITINKTLSKNNEIGYPKTQSSRRVIPLFDNAAEIALRNKDIVHKDKRITEDRLFKIGNTKCREAFMEILEIANITDFKIHDLRHTFCTRCMESGVPAEQTMRWAGHSDISITQRYYIHINKDFENKNIALVNKNGKGV